MGRRYSRSPSPMGYSRRDRSPSPKGRHGSHGRDLPTSLLVGNLRYDCRLLAAKFCCYAACKPEDLRGPFGEFGPLKDVYLPRDYYTVELRGFGFVQYVDPDDAAESKYQTDGQILLGRELTVVFAEENRKKPSEMRARERSYSPSRRYSRTYSRSPDYYSPSTRRRHYSRSISPRDRRYRGRSYSRTPDGSRRSWSRSPVKRSRSWSRSCSSSPY
ncbi:hypothetical protein Pfo_030317 [Paulownia fortunei]|nr:hypothetical protein Pfo_030317 [Paulownia fortunei]